MDSIGIIIDIVIIGGLTAFIVWNTYKIYKILKKRKEKKRIEAQKAEEAEAQIEERKDNR